MRRVAGAAAALFLTVIGAAAAAQTPGSRQTRDFVQAAAESDTFEMMEAYSALAESHDPRVRAYAQRMIRDHGDTSRALAQAATSAGLMPPTMAVGASQAPLLAALQSKRGADFDHAYWQQQVLAHRSALTVEQQYAAGGDVPAIRRAAAAAVPVIQAHLSMAESMAAPSAG